MKSFRNILLALAGGAVLLAGGLAPAHAQQRGMECLTDRQVQQAIESGTIQSWPKVKRLAGIEKFEEVSDVQVCMISGTPYYMLNVISPAGEAMRITLNAVDGTREVL